MLEAIKNPEKFTYVKNFWLIDTRIFDLILRFRCNINI